MLVPVKDAAALTPAIARLLENPDESRHMGVQRRQRAIEEFSQGG